MELEDVIVPWRDPANGIVWGGGLQKQSGLVSSVASMDDPSQLYVSKSSTLLGAAPSHVARSMFRQNGPSVVLRIVHIHWRL